MGKVFRVAEAARELGCSERVVNGDRVEIEANSELITRPAQKIKVDDQEYDKAKATSQVQD